MVRLNFAHCASPRPHVSTCEAIPHAAVISRLRLPPPRPYRRSKDANTSAAGALRISALCNPIAKKSRHAPMSFGRPAGPTHEIGILIQTEGDMTIANKTVLITGANRGIGRALVNEALRRAQSGSMRERADPCRAPTSA
jgi:hypothetical protein